MVDLDNLAEWRQYDPEDMLGHISRLPQQCAEAWQNVGRSVLPEGYQGARNIVVLGLGGSAIGGDLVRTLVLPECAVPMLVVRDYAIPAFVGPETLVIASSHSGNTEETLLTAEAARQAGAMVAVVTTGGQLAAWAAAHALPIVRFHYPSQPRAALGHSLILVLGILCQLGLVASKAEEVQEAVAVMRGWQSEIVAPVPLAANAAKGLALWLLGGLPVIYGAGYLSEVARRWKGQFNENAKAWSFFEQMPELNHNAVAGFEVPRAVGELVRVVMLLSSLDHPRNRRRFEVTQEVLERSGIQHRVVEARGSSPLAQLLSAIHFGDYVSYYLAMLYKMDPTPIGNITYLKQRLGG